MLQSNELTNLCKANSKGVWSTDCITCIATFTAIILRTRSVEGEVAEGKGGGLLDIHI